MKDLLIAKDDLIANQEAAILDLNQQVADSNETHESLKIKKEEQLVSLHNDVEYLTTTLAAKDELLQQMRDDAVGTPRAITARLLKTSKARSSP